MIEEARRDTRTPHRVSCVCVCVRRESRRARAAQEESGVGVEGGGRRAPGLEKKGRLSFSIASLTHTTTRTLANGGLSLIIVINDAVAVARARAASSTTRRLFTTTTTTPTSLVVARARRPGYDYYH